VRWVPREREEREGGADGFLKPWRLGGIGKKRKGRGACGRVHVDGEGGRERGPWRGVGSAGRLAAAPGRRAQAAPLPREQGRATCLGDMGGCRCRANRGGQHAWATRAADARDWGEERPGDSGVVRERAKKTEAGQRRGSDMRARAAQRLAAQFKLGLSRNQNSNEIKLISNSFRL
jgi:hypothetical protein